VVERDARGRVESQLAAREGSYNQSARTCTFKQGRETQYDPETGDLLTTTGFIEKEINRFDEDPQLIVLYDMKPNRLSFAELRRIAAFFSEDDSPKRAAYAVRCHGLVADTAMPAIVALIAIPFAVSGMRVNPAVSVSKCLGLFLAYMLLQKAFYALGGGGSIDSAIAVWIPNVVFFLGGSWLFLRMK